MSAITHHPGDELLAAYAAGTLPHAYSLVLASHISLCAQCRAALEAHQMAGGAVIESGEGVSISDGLLDDILGELDSPYQPEPIYERKGPYPGPVMAALKGREPQWKRVGMGVRQSILSESDEGVCRLFHIPPGQAMPDHGHKGIELTLVLQGSFSDETGQYCAGDLEVADETLEHTPIADEGMPCICLAATDAPLKFRALVPRLLQPIFRI